MKAFAVVCLLVVGAAAQYGSAPASPMSYGSSAPAAYGSSAPASYGTTTQTQQQVPIMSYSRSITGGLSDSLSFAAGNGIQQSENTQVVAGRGGSYEGENGQMIQSTSSLVKSGSVSYTSPEGVPVTLTYTADEGGYKPSGSHLPVAPAMPAELVEAYAKATAAAPASYSSYSAPAAPAASYSSYSAPAAPAAPVASYSSYSAPAAPAAPVASYSSYSAPAAPPQEVRVSYGSSNPVQTGY